jgi:hypothetical protein
MSLADKEWRPASMHKVVSAWLRAERNENDGIRAIFGRIPELVWLPGLNRLLDQARLDDPEENRARLRLLYMYRNLFAVELPPDTRWYEVRSLMHPDLNNLHVVNFHTFIDEGDRKELMKVAARKTSVE